MSNYKQFLAPERPYLPEGCLLNRPENRDYISSYAGLAAAMEVGAVCEAPAVLCSSDMTLSIDLGSGVRGIIERDEAVYCRDGEEIKNIAIITRVGKPVCFKVMSFRRGDDGMPVAVLSRRAAQKECFERFLMRLSPGDILPARVTHLEHFGAFVDIGCGVISLLSIDCISISRISHPRDRFRPGMYINAAVKSVDKECGRIFMTHKELLGTWEENAALFDVGQTVSGIVRSIEDYGIFIELSPNLAGLAEIRDGIDVKVGQKAAVYIKSMIPDRMKIKLVLIDICEDESDDIQNYSVSDDISDFNYFIDADTTTHIDSWCYSPENCCRVIETRFDSEKFDGEEAVGEIGCGVSCGR